MAVEGTPAGTISPTDEICDIQNAIKAKQTQVDGCSVLPKLQCHEVHMGQDARLLWNLKTPDGEFVNITNCQTDCDLSAGSTTTTESFDAVGTPPCGIQLRMRELSGFDPSNDLVHVIDVEVLDEGTGYVKAASLPDEITSHAGVYLEEWGLFTSDNRMLFSNQCCTFVRRGLFGLTANPVSQEVGPPTLEEIRLSIRDNSPEDNLLLDNVEFDAAEIAQAVVRPIQYWNEISPPLNPIQTTKTFPFREMWLQGIHAYLFDIATHHYRRNDLQYSAGGINIADKNKEQQYIAASQAKLQQFQIMCKNKKIEINTALFTGSVNSIYSGLFY